MRGLAEQMGVTSAAISEWNQGHKPIPDERIRQLAKIAGQEPGPWLLLIHSEQDKGELGKEWAKLYKRLGMAAMALVLCIGAALPGRAQASSAKDEVHISTEDNAHALYIMRNGVECYTGAATLDLALDQILPAKPFPSRNGTRRMTDTYNLDLRPPCWPVGEQCPNSCAADLHRRVVTNHVELTGPWAGWRLAGRDLVAPSGERIPERRLRGLLWHANASDIRDSVRRRNAKRKAVQQSMVKVVVVDLGEWRDRHFGRIAG